MSDNKRNSKYRHLRYIFILNVCDRTNRDIHPTYNFVLQILQANYLYQLTKQTNKSFYQGHIHFGAE